jgi:small multidrug resistance pump
VTAWLFLALAIIAEVTGTLELRAVAGGSARWPVIALVAVAYVVSFGFMTLALRHIGVGAVYAIWSGAGTAAVAAFGWWLFGERIGWVGALGMALIVGGVIVLVASGSTHHAGAAR